MNQSRMDEKKETRVKKLKKEKTTDVLYQKMGDRWYTFVVINDEVFVGIAPQSVIEEKLPFHKKKDHPNVIRK